MQVLKHGKGSDVLRLIKSSVREIITENKKMPARILFQHYLWRDFNKPTLPPSSISGDRLVSKLEPETDLNRGG